MAGGLRDDVAKGEFIAFWMGAGVMAGMNVNIWDATDAIQTLVRGQPVNPAQLGRWKPFSMPADPGSVADAAGIRHPGTAIRQTGAARTAPAVPPQRPCRQPSAAVT